MNFETYARAFDPQLYDELRPYRVKDEALMPEEYRYPNGRWRQDDQVFFKDQPRKLKAYRVPQPFRIVSGSKTQDWLLFDRAYPLSPDTQTKTETWVRPEDGKVFELFYVLADRGGYGLVEYEAFINGRWRSVFKKYTDLWLGKRLSWYKGLHQDQHVSPPWAPSGFRPDLMCWFPEVACSWVKEPA